MQALLFLLALLLPSGAGAEEIIGGVEAIPHSRPYMAHLEFINERGEKDSCGGFLITRQFVLTAAHCRGREITVTLGAHDLSKRESTQQKIRVKNQIIHKDYNSIPHLHDIMLLKLEKPVELTPAVKVVRLPLPSDFIHPWRICRAAGWGHTGVRNPASNTLREVEMIIMDAKTCQGYRFYQYRFQVCVGSPRSLNTPYVGDSGGPLMCAGVAHGIVSYGHGDGKPPAVFTRISTQVPWIDTVVRASS